jgi:hypothetical protein
VPLGTIKRTDEVVTLPNTFEMIAGGVAQFTVISCKPMQPVKTLLSIEVTDEGIVIEVSNSQFAKARFLKEVTE